MAQLRERYARGSARFGLIVAFSGVEHDGLGRCIPPVPQLPSAQPLPKLISTAKPKPSPPLHSYGDPLNANGDLAAIREMVLCLREGGLLLLAVPTCSRDLLLYPWHRVYGPKRLGRLLNASGELEMLGRVWGGQVVQGGLERAAVQPTLWSPKCADWQHQQVLVLKRRRAPVSTTP